MKRIISIALACLMMLPLLPISVAAGDPSIYFYYYQENFDSYTTGTTIPAAIGWETASGELTYEIDNGKLVLTNSSNADAFSVFLASATTNAMVQNSYTVELDMTFLQEATGLVGPLAGYNRNNGDYNILYLRPKDTGSANDAAFQNKTGNKFFYLDSGGTEYQNKQFAVLSKNSIWDRLSVSADKSLVNDPLKIRLEVDYTNKVVRVFINNQYITATSSEDNWNTFLSTGSTELGFRISKSQKIAIDNVKVYTKLHTVTFDTDGGSKVDAMKTNNLGKLASLPAAPTKEGHTFAGWYNGDTEVTTNTVFTADTKVTAKWTENTPAPTTYTVTFNPNGGTLSTTSMPTDAAGKLAALPIPTQAGHNFLGWYTDTEEKVELTTVYTADTTLTAKWVEVITDPSVYYQQNFDYASDGTIDPAALGWETVSGNLTYEIDDGKLVLTNSSNADAFSVFLPANVTDEMVKNSYIVELDMTFLQSATGLVGPLAGYNRNNGDYNILYLRPQDTGSNDAAFQNKTGSSWIYLDSGGTEYQNKQFAVLSKDSIWTRLSVSADKSLVNDLLKIRLEVDHANKVVRVFINDQYITATSTENSWNKFISSGGTELGFRISKSQKIAIDNIKVSVGNFVAAPTYTITFDPAGGTISQTVMVTNKNGKLDTFPMPLKEGFIFDGWFNAQDEEITVANIFTADTTLTAKWSDDPALNNTSATSPNLWLAVLMMRYNRTFDIKAVATEGGTITPAGITQVKYNTSQTYKITPNAGYKIADVVVDDVSLGKVNSYTFKKVTKAHTIFVVFEETETVPTTRWEGGSTYYEENFDSYTAGTTTPAAIGWETVSGDLTYEIDDGKLVLTNTNSSADAFSVFLPSGTTDAMAANNYVVELDMTFLEDSTNLVGLLAGYDRVNGDYNIVYLRPKDSSSNDAGFQNTTNGWIYLDNSGTEYQGVSYTALKKDVIWDRLGVSDKSLYGETVKIRLEVDQANKIARVFLNEKYITATSTENDWNSFLSTGNTELGLRIAKGQKVAIDNIKVSVGNFVAAPN